MPHLSDTQLVLLSTAAQRSDGSLMPVCYSLSDHAGRLTRTVRALLKQGMIVEADAPDLARGWRRDGDQAIGIFITDAGRVAIGTEPATAEPDNPVPAAAVPIASEPPKAPPKIVQVLGLLRREEGATLAELVAVTGWLPHTTRAALTRLRQQGHVLHKGKRGDLTRYAIVEIA